MDIEQIYRKNFNGIVRYISSRIDAKHDAEDIAQEVFIKMYNTPDGCVEKGRIQQVLRVMAMNMILNYKTRSHEITMGELPDIPAEDYDYTNDLQEMLNEYEGLTPREKECLEFRFAGLSLREIANELKVTRESVKGYLKNARKKRVEAM